MPVSMSRYIHSQFEDLVQLAFFSNEDLTETSREIGGWKTMTMRMVAQKTKITYLGADGDKGTYIASQQMGPFKDT